MKSDYPAAVLSLCLTPAADPVAKGVSPLVLLLVIFTALAVVTGLAIAAFPRYKTAIATASMVLSQAVATIALAYVLQS
jgi:hypothetical protein